MKCATEMSLDAMIYIPTLIKTGSSIQKLLQEIQGHRQHGGRLSLLLFAQNNGNRLKNTYNCW
jgi:hypothetical protein